jgi:Xaa-Pro aminopeptidase
MAANTTVSPQPTLQISLARPPHRLERVRTWMEEQQVDCLLMFGADHINHLGGYWRYFGGPAALVVGKDGMRTLVVMRDEAPIAAESAAVDEVVGYGERGFGLDLDPAATLIATVAGLPEIAAATRIGFASELPGIEARLEGQVAATRVDAGDALQRIRLVKDEDELARIHAAYELCWLGQDAVATAAQTGASEIEMFTAAQAAAQIEAGAPIEFVCDLLSGPNTAEVCCPIHVAGRRAVDPGEAVIADVVVRAAGYWGDSAETHARGDNDEADAMRSELLAILRSTGARLIPGATGAEVFREVDARIKSAFPEGEFPHHAGHGLGVGSFEDPHIIPTDTRPFEEWMVVAVEPGVYFPGRVGARVENVFVVTPDGGVELRRAFGGGPDADA